MLTVQRIEGLVDLLAVEPEWWAIWSADPLATPFQSPAWLLPWAAAFQPKTSFGLLARRSGRAVALLPLVALDDGTRVLSMGAGNGDRLGACIDPVDGAHALPALMRALDADPVWSVLEFGQLDPGTPLATVAAPWPEDRVAGEPCPVVAPLSPRTRRSHAQNLRTARNRMARVGEWRVVRIGGADLAKGLDRFAALHGLRWGEGSMVSDPALMDFHRRAVFALEAAGLLRLHALELDGRTLAMNYGLAAKGRHFCHLTAFDPAAGRFSPGNVLIDAVMRDAAAEGLRAFDFLRGREAYKYAWAAVDQPTLIRRFRRLRAVTGWGTDDGETAAGTETRDDAGNDCRVR